MPLDYLSILVTAVVAGGGAYFGSYLKKKGENLATHEDVDKLVDQVAVVTETTKQIEAKISNDVWERQRKWEMKRDALFEALKDIGSMETCLHKYIATYEEARKAPSEHQLVWGDRKLEAIELSDKCKASFTRTLILATLVCSEEVKDKFGTVNLVILRMFDLANNGNAQAATKMGLRYAAVIFLRPGPKGPLPGPLRATAQNHLKPPFGAELEAVNRSESNLRATGSAESNSGGPVGPVLSRLQERSATKYCIVGLGFRHPS
jgi:hypothetical protein